MNSDGDNYDYYYYMIIHNSDLLSPDSGDNYQTQISLRIIVNPFYNGWISVYLHIARNNLNCE